MADWKDTCNLPRTPFSMKANLQTIEPETVARWDAEETSRKIELQVGRDLQWIRINGTVVGALAGLVIHAVGELVIG